MERETKQVEETYTGPERLKTKTEGERKIKIRDEKYRKNKSGRKANEKVNEKHRKINKWRKGKEEYETREPEKK